MLLIEQSENAKLFINVDTVESMKQDGSVYLVRMCSGDTFIVSPMTFSLILSSKRAIDQTSQQGVSVGGIS